MRLSSASLASLPQDIETFGYDRENQKIGMVHIGLGAFHRAHQAWYLDRAMQAGDRDWAILGVSLRSDEVAEQLNPQDGLYTLIERSAGQSQLRVVGALRRVLGPAAGDEAIIASLAASSTHIASFTVTEKGYCRAVDGDLDFELAERGFFPLLRAAFARRRDAGLPGLTLLSCDNLQHNGRVLEHLVGAYLDRRDPCLRRWFESECATPCTMVDRIVPSPTRADRGEVLSRLGLEDLATVATEPFSQWIIEDRFAGPRPRLENVGARIVPSVTAYETAKLRMLNGAHSALAYLGLERGYTYVHEAIADAGLRAIVEQLMRFEAACSFSKAPGQDLGAYSDELLERFENPELRHRLAQIAMDGSQKIPQRWLASLAALRAQGKFAPATLTALGAWLRHLRGDSVPVNDPLAERLRKAWEGADLQSAAMRIFGPDGMLPSEWSPTTADIAVMTAKPG